jgi:hypothetical protein
MKNTKVDLINEAYSKLRISGLTVLPSPEDLETALTRLENMMSELEVGGIQLEYNFEDDPDPNSVTNIPRFSFDGISSALAIRLIPDFNKVPSIQLLASAEASMSVISGKVAKDRLRQVQYPRRMPIGSGNRTWGRWARFYYPVAIPPVDSIQMLVGEINNYISSFQSYLKSTEDIDTFTVEVSGGLTLLSSSVVGDTVNFELQADTPIWQTVTVTIVTTEGREEIRVINVEVNSPEVA